MNKTLKKTLSIILTILMIVTTVPFAFAADEKAHNAVAVEFAESGFIKDDQSVNQWDYSSSYAEGPENMLDGDPYSKFCVVIYGNIAFSDLCDYYYITVKTTNEESAFISGYQLVTGNDSPERDPVSWKLYGSNNKENWTVIDSREDAEITDERNAEVDFTLSNIPESYKYFRFEFEKLKQDQTTFQLSEIILWEHKHIASTESCGGYICSECNCWYGEGEGSHNNFSNGICHTCGYKCEHMGMEDNTCDKCNLVCNHSDVTQDCRGYYCADCKSFYGEGSEHNFVGKVCSACGIKGGSCGTDVTWLLDNNGLLTISGTGPMSNYVERESPFYSNLDITTVVIEEGITRIGKYAFNNCENIVSVSIPDGVTEIGDYAFNNCISLTSPTIPSGITRIGDYAFYWCKGIKNIALPNSVTSLGSRAFYGCDALESVTLSDNITSINDYTFMLCTNLKNVTIPSKVTSIGEYAFSFTDISNVIIPDGATSIGGSAFSVCTSLESVTIPKSVTSIGRFAFDATNKLTTVNAPCSWILTPLYSFNSGVKLNFEHNFDDETCTACGYGCEHSFENSVCTKCHTKCNHSFENGACTSCSANCETLGHDFVNGICKICGIACETLGHDFRNGICQSCRYSCEHNFENGICTVCEVTCETLGHKFKNSICVICSYECTHSWSHYNTCYTCGIPGGEIKDSVTELFWYIDEETGTLKVIGTGAIPDYYRYDVPWYGFADLIKAIIISEGVTLIPYSAFMYCTEVVSLTLPKTVTEIATYAFESMKSGTVYVPCKWEQTPECTFNEGVTVVIEGHNYNNSGVCNSCENGCPHEKYTMGICDECNYLCPHENFTEGKCDVCEAVRADYTAFDAAVEELRVLLAREDLIDSPKQGYTSGLNGVLNAVGYNRTENEQIAVNNGTQTLNGYIAAVKVGIEDGSMIKADWSKMEALFDEINALIENDTNRIVDAYKGLYTGAQAYYNGCVNSTTFTQQSYNNNIVYEQNLEELLAGLKDGTMLKFDGEMESVKLQMDFMGAVFEMFEKYGEDRVSEIEEKITENGNGERAAAIINEVAGLTGSVAENADKLAELKAEMDAFIDEFDRCCSGTHTFENYAETTPAKCRVNAKETGICTLCDEPHEREVVGSALTHSFTKYEEVTAPKCGVAGEEVAACDNGCGETDEREIPALTHKDDDGDYTCDNGCEHEFEKPAEPDIPDTPDEPTDGDCDHICHKDGILGFLWKIISFFFRLFNIQQYCDCGVLHYDAPLIG